MKKVILTTILFLINFNFVYADIEVKYMRDNSELLYVLLDNELFTEKESLKFFKNHTMIYKNLQTKETVTAKWMVSSYLSPREIPEICFIDIQNAPADRHEYGICMSIYQMYKKSSLDYLISYKSHLLKNNERMADSKYPQDEIYSKHYFKLRYDRDLLTHNNQKKKEIKQQRELKDKHNNYLNSIRKVSDLPKAAKYIRRNHLNIDDYMFQFGFIKGIKNLTKSSFFNSVQYRYLFNQAKPSVYAKGSQTNFHIHLRYSTILQYKFDFPVTCSSKAVSGGTQRTCIPSHKDMRLIRKYQKYINKLGYADEFSKALKNSVTKIFIPKKIKHKYNYSSSSSIEYVMIQAECINGLIPCIEKNLKITGSPGRFEPSYGGANSGTIYKGYNNKIAGRYSFTVTFDKSLCSGSFYLSGTKKNYSINLSKECSDNGSREW